MLSRFKYHFKFFNFSPSQTIDLLSIMFDGVTLRTTTGIYKLKYQYEINTIRVNHKNKLAATIPLRQGVDCTSDYFVTIQKGENAPLLLCIVSILVDALSD